MTTAPKTIGVGLLGCGTVGAALVQALDRRQGELSAKTGLDLAVRRVAVRDPGKQRGTALGAEAFTDDPYLVVKDPEVQVVVEVMGGIEPARSLIAAALEAGKPVVTANKELMATHGLELSALAEAKEVDLLYEAAVGGGIPVIRPLRESLAGEGISRVAGIVNGTTNYILTRMTEEGATYADALSEAQALGFAEADPTADVEGFDAAAKAAIIANVAFGANVSASDVHRDGITEITAEDIGLARRLGYVVKPLAVVHRSPAGAVGVRVHPAMLPVEHPLASVRLSFNALFVEGDEVGELMFYGRGAGGGPTASAVLGDLIDAAHNFSTNASGRRAKSGIAEPWPMADQSSAFYVALDVVDEPGVLSAVAAAFGDNAVSIRSMEQLGLGHEARLVFVTHQAREEAMNNTIAALRNLPHVRRVGNVIRVVEA